MEDQHVLTVNGHIIGGQIGVYVTAQWYIKNAASLQHQVSCRSLRVFYTWLLERRQLYHCLYYIVYILKLVHYTNGAANPCMTMLAIVFWLLCHYLSQQEKLVQIKLDLLSNFWDFSLVLQTGSCLPCCYKLLMYALKTCGLKMLSLAK